MKHTEMYQIKVGLCVMMPIVKACDAMQGDAATVVDAQKALACTEEDMKLLCSIRTGHLFTAQRAVP